MAKNDFFSYVTSLKPIEMKAIGELSQVIHLEENAVIETGEKAADALYIVNRGAIEVIHADPRMSGGQAMSYLSRGDMFGETSVLSGTPTRNIFRACESTSVQCFRRRDFPELMRRVPSFFFYLAAKLATRLVQVSDMTFMQSDCLELSGNLANFDLVTIYQTILNSSQTGELSIYQDKNDRVGTFYFDTGQPKYGQYHRLLGEQAFWQLFLPEKLIGTFSFTLCEAPPESLRSGQIIQRHPTDMLITALQYRDEFKSMMETAPDRGSVIHRAKLNLHWDGDEPWIEDLRWLAELVWQHCYSQPIAIGELAGRLPVNELDYYKVVQKLLDTLHLSMVHYESPQMATAV